LTLPFLHPTPSASNAATLCGAASRYRTASVVGEPVRQARASDMQAEPVQPFAADEDRTEGFRSRQGQRRVEGQLRRTRKQRQEWMHDEIPLPAQGPAGERYVKA
jgi:hypothetical protein